MIRDGYIPAASNFFYIQKKFAKEVTFYTTYRKLNYTTGTIPLGAKFYDYSVASQKNEDDLDMNYERKINT